MDRELTPLRSLGARLAEVQDAEAASSNVRARARMAFLSGPGERSMRRAKPATYGVLALAFVACAAAAAVVSSRRQAGVDHIDHAPITALGMTGETSWVAATKESALPLRFSDGSEVTLAAAARARIVNRTEAGASVAIERGQLHAKIRHRTDTAWRFEAGPYDVRVTGTAFSLSWDPTSASMVLRLEEGSVVVTGCNLEERRVAAGEELRLRCEREAADSGATAPPAPIAVGDLGNVAEVSPAAPRRPAPAAAPAPAPAPAGPSWRELAASARYPEAYEAAQREGLDAIGQNASAPDLLAIADAARLTRHARESDALLTAIRRRFPGTESAAVAAFVLGRSAMDGRGAYAEAATWFETALREQPNGALAREAAGLVVEASDRAGDLPRARASAAAYLQKYPTGPHAELAHRVLARATEPKR
jgi:transmembrane sensor